MPLERVDVQLQGVCSTTQHGEQSWEVLDADAWWQQHTGADLGGTMVTSSTAESADGRQRGTRDAVEKYGQPQGPLTLLEDKFKKLTDKVCMEDLQSPPPSASWISSSPTVDERAATNQEGTLSGKVLFPSPSKPITSPPRLVNANGHRILSHPQVTQEVRVFSAGGDSRPVAASKMDTPSELAKTRERSLDRFSTAAVSHHSLSPTPKESLFDRVDVNHDGLISRTEFDKALAEKQIAEGPQDGMDELLLRAPSSPRMPGAVAKALESVVAHQIDGLGECLNICAQRSRTLKLLGFQHLHFDARLQAYLEQKARSLGYLVLDLLILVRTFLGMREVTRNGCLWRSFKKSQYRVRQEVSKKRKATQHALSQLSRHLAATFENILRLFFDEWMRTMWEERKGAAEEQKMQVLMEMQSRAMKSFMVLMCTDETSVLRSFFIPWRGLIQRRQSREAKLQQTQVRIISWMSEVRLEFLSCWKWVVETERLFRSQLQDVHSKYQRKTALQRRGSVLALEQSDKHRCGTLQRISVRSWKEIVARTRYNRFRKEQNLTRVFISISATDEHQRIETFRGWREVTRQSSMQRSQGLARERFMLRSFASSERAAVQTAFESWVEVVRSQKKLRTSTSLCHRKILHGDETLLLMCFMWWCRVQLSDTCTQLSDTCTKSQGQINRYREGRARSRLAMDKQFQAAERAVCLECLTFWQQAVARKRAEMQRKESNKERALRSIAGDDLSATRHVFHEWARVVSSEKRERHLEETQNEKKAQQEKAQQEKLALYAKNFNMSCEARKESSFVAWKALLDQKRRLQASFTSTNRMVQRMQYECLNGFFSVWQYDTNITVKTRLKERLRRLEEEGLKRRQSVYQTLTRQVQQSGLRCLSSCFQAWMADVRRRLAMKKYDAKSAMLISNEVEALRSACFMEWMRDVHRSKHSKLLEEYSGLQQERQDMQQKVAQNMMIGFSDSLRQICFGEWASWVKKMRTHNDRKQKSVAQILRQEAQGHVAIVQTFFFEWHREILTCKRERAQQKMRNRIATHITRQLAVMCESVSRECYRAWQSCVEDARRAKEEKEQHRLRAARMIADPDRELLYQCLKNWSEVTQIARVAKQASQRCDNVKHLAGAAIRRLASKNAEHSTGMYVSRCFYDWLHYQRTEAKERQLADQFKQTEQSALLARTGVLFVLAGCSLELVRSFIVMSWRRLTKVNKVIRRNALSLGLALRRAVISQIAYVWSQHTLMMRRLGQGKRVVKAMYGSSADMILVNCLVFWFGDVMYKRKGRNRKQIIRCNAERNIKVADDFVVYCSLLSWKVTTDCAGVLKKSDSVLCGIRSNVRAHGLVKAVAEVARVDAVCNEMMKWYLIRIWWHLVECAHHDKRFKEDRLAMKAQLSHMRFCAMQHQVRCNGATWAGDPNPELLLLAWQMEAKRQLYDKSVRNVAYQLQANTLARTRMHAERLGRRWERLELARCIVLWRMVMHVEYEHHYVATKHLRCQCLGRAFIVKLQRRIYEQRFLYRWLWVCPPKPREIEFPQFSKDSPTFYVRPVSAGVGVESRWPVSYMAGTDDKKWAHAPQHAIADRQHYQYRHERPVSAALTTESMVQTVPPQESHQGAGIFEQQLETSERLALANRAISSDYEYRRLFEQNRREIRDGPARCHLCGRSRDEIPIYSCRSRSGDTSKLTQTDVGVIGNMVAECVCQKMAQRLDFTTESAASVATVAQVANTVKRPQSARPFSTASTL